MQCVVAICCEEMGKYAHACLMYENERMTEKIFNALATCFAGPVCTSYQAQLITLVRGPTILRPQPWWGELPFTRSYSLQYVNIETAHVDAGRPCRHVYGLSDGLHGFGLGVSTSAWRVLHYSTTTTTLKISRSHFVVVCNHLYWLRQGQRNQLHSTRSVEWRGNLPLTVKDNDNKKLL